MKKFLTAVLMILLINFANVSAETLDDAVRQLDKLRQDMECQRIKEQINEDRNREDSDLKFLITEKDLC